MKLMVRRFVDYKLWVVVIASKWQKGRGFLLTFTELRSITISERNTSYFQKLFSCEYGEEHLMIRYFGNLTSSGETRVNVFVGRTEFRLKISPKSPSFCAAASRGILLIIQIVSIFLCDASEFLCQNSANPLESLRGFSLSYL
jgi:hypothetical protein